MHLSDDGSTTGPQLVSSLAQEGLQPPVPFRSLLRAQDIPAPLEQVPVLGSERRTELRFAHHPDLPPLERALGFTIAKTRSQLTQAFELVGRSYCDAGLEPESRGELRVFPHHALDTTQVFSAIYRPELERPVPDRARVREQGETIATVSLVQDGVMGLAMDHVAPQQLDALRDSGARLAEMNSLAMSPQFRQSSLIMRLHRLVVEYAMLKGVTHLVVSSIYKHASMYQRCLGFEPLGEPVRYWDGEGAVVQPMQIPIERGQRSIARFNRNRPIDANLESFFFEDGPGGREPAESGAWTRDDLNYYFGDRQSDVSEWVGSRRIGAWSGELNLVSGGKPH